MSKSLKENVPGCCDPNKPFKPIAPNNCQTCKDHADYTCHDFVGKKENDREK
jgi:hypothetical protein